MVCKVVNYCISMFLKSFIWVIQFPLGFVYDDADQRQQNNFKDSSVRADKQTYNGYSH